MLKQKPPRQDSCIIVICLRTYIKSLLQSMKPVLKHLTPPIHFTNSFRNPSFFQPIEFSDSTS